MRTLIISALMLFFTLSSYAQPKDPFEKNNLFSVSMPNLFLSNLTMSYERLFENNSSAVIKGGLTLKDNVGMSKIGANGEFQYRFHSEIRKDRAFQGVFFGPFLSYRYIDIKDESYDYINDIYVVKPTHDFFSSAMAGVTVGCKIAIVSTVVFGFEIGGGLKYTTGTRKAYSYDIFDEGYSGIIPKADITLGIFF